MTKVKNYWNEIKDQETSFTGGSRGWYVPLRFEDDWKYDRKTGEEVKVRKLKLQFPFGSGDGVSREEKRQCREDVMQQKKLRRKLAMASRNEEEYRDLRSRFFGCSEEEKDQILNSKLKGFELGDFIRSKFLTNMEANSLFYSM
jgi:hypothetical protein